MNRSNSSLALLALSCVALPAAATTYTLEPNYTQVVFRWNHLGYSFPAAQVGQGSGMLDFDEKDPARARVSVTIPLSTLITGVPDLDEHLASEDFFERTKFPDATFVSTKVEKGATGDRLKVTGNVTIRGTTKPLTLEVTLLGTGTNERTGIATVGFNATGVLKRSDFDLGAFVPQVGDSIELQITCQAAESKGYAAYLEKQKTKK